jgi:hypothetical protein
LCKELLGAWWDRQLLGWDGSLSKRGVGDRGGLKWTRDELKLKSSDKTNFPLSKEQAPNSLAKRRTVLDDCRNMQQELDYGAQL